MESTLEHYQGHAIRHDVRANRTWSPGRVCDAPGCRTRLSIYNRQPKCGVHEETRSYVVRGRRRSARTEEVMPTFA